MWFYVIIFENGQDGTEMKNCNGVLIESSDERGRIWKPTGSVQ